MADQVLRFVFVSGMVAERRGTDETVANAFDMDSEGLIDYVLSIDLVSGECAFFTREGDDRMDEEVILTMARPGA